MDKSLGCKSCDNILCHCTERIREFCEEKQRNIINTYHRDIHQESRFGTEKFKVGDDDVRLVSEDDFCQRNNTFFDHIWRVKNAFYPRHDIGDFVIVIIKTQSFHLLHVDVLLLEEFKRSTRSYYLHGMSL